MIPINVDYNCTKHTYTETHTLVSSIFYTLQGEGKYTGQPFIFLRLAGCNFGAKTNVCTQCDTAFQIANATPYIPGDLLNELTRLSDSTNCKNIVLTGGEPTLQRSVLSVLTSWVKKYPDCLIQIETNGTQPEFFKDPRFIQIRSNIQVCCSPKCNEVTKRYAKIPDAVANNVDFYKFLISADESSCYFNLPDYFYALDKLTYISPVTCYLKAPDSEVASIWDSTLVDHVQTANNYSRAAKVVLELQQKNLSYNVFLSLQTHLFTAIA